MDEKGTTVASQIQKKWQNYVGEGQQVSETKNPKDTSLSLSFLLWETDDNTRNRLQILQFFTYKHRCNVRDDPSSKAYEWTQA